MTTYYKATRPDGTDFRTGTINYAQALAADETLTHPDAHWNHASGYLSISVAPGETLIGGRWPCRLFTVEPVGEARTVDTYQHKRAVHALRVVEEVDAWQALGPNGASVAQFIESIPQALENSAWDAAWDAALASAWNAARDAARDAALASARDGARDAARDSAWNAARDATWNAAWNAALDVAGDAPGGVPGGAARDAAWAIVVKDMITPTQFDTLTRPWRILTGQDN